jgi:hypothetical protein
MWSAPANRSPACCGPCCNAAGRDIGRELFDDDTPIAPTFDMGWHTYVRPFGLNASVTRACRSTSMVMDSPNTI